MLRFDMNFLYTMINLIVLAFLLKKFLIKPVTDIMEKRRQLIEDGLKNAQNAQEDAMKMKEEYAQALGGAKEESVRIVEKARKDAKSEYERIVKEADARAGSIIESAKADIRVEREQTMSALQSEIAGLAMTAAAKLFHICRTQACILILCQSLNQLLFFVWTPIAFFNSIDSFMC